MATQSSPGQAVRVVHADLNRPVHQDAVVGLLDAYAADPMGAGKPLSAEVKRALIPGLQQHPTTIIFLAFQAERPVGVARVGCMVSSPAFLNQDLTLP